VGRGVGVFPIANRKLGVLNNDMCASFSTLIARDAEAQPLVLDALLPPSADVPVLYTMHDVADEEDPRIACLVLFNIPLSGNQLQEVGERGGSGIRYMHRKDVSI
jgi:hypothetical protein